MCSTLLVRDLDRETKTALQAQAARNGRPMSAEARIVLRDALIVRAENGLSAAAHADRFFPPDLRIEGGLLSFEEFPADATDFG